MQRIDENTVAVTNAEAATLAAFIMHTLDRAWDTHTDTFICSDTSWQQGMRRMDPELYDLAQQLEAI